MITTRPDDFEQLLKHIERQAEEEGPHQIADLRAREIKYKTINQLIERRRHLHWSQSQLAERAGIGQAQISRIESGRMSPTLATHARLCAALGIPEPMAAVASTSRRGAFSSVSARIGEQLADQGVSEERDLADSAAARRSRRRR